MILQKNCKVAERKMFICSIRKLLELKCLVLFSCCFKHLLQTHKKPCTWFVVACNDGQFFRDLFSIEFLASFHNEDFSNIFVVSLFFFSDDRFISKYLLSSPTTPESSNVLYTFHEGHNLLHLMLVSFTQKAKLNSGELASSLRFLDLLKKFCLRKINWVISSADLGDSMTQCFATVGSFIYLRVQQKKTTSFHILFLLWCWRCRCWMWQQRNNILNMRSSTATMKKEDSHLVIINNAVWLIGKYFLKKKL